MFVGCIVWTFFSSSAQIFGQKICAHFVLSREIFGYLTKENKTFGHTFLDCHARNVWGYVLSKKYIWNIYMVYYLHQLKHTLILSVNTVYGSWVTVWLVKIIEVQLVFHTCENTPYIPNIHSLIVLFFALLTRFFLISNSTMFGKNWYDFSKKFKLKFTYRWCTFQSWYFIC